MKTNYIHKFYFFFGILFILSACTNDLDVTPKDDDEFLSEEFYASSNSYKQALAGIYGNLSLTGTSGAGSSNLQGIDPGTSQYARTLWYLQDLAADEPIWSYENDEGGAVKEIQRNTWGPSNTILLGFFSRAMFTVALTNDFLRQTTPEVIEARGHTLKVGNDIKAYRAEARLLRALAYYHMMDLFGKAAFVTENDPIGTFQGPQYDRTQLFQFVESELLAIEGDLIAPRQNEYARADKAVAWTILAKIYLNAKVYTGQEKNTECITYTKKVIGSGFSLASDYSLNFLADNDFNEAGRNEIIFHLVSDGVVTQNYGATTVIINGEVGSLESNSAALGAQGWGGALRVRKQFANKFLNGDVPLTDKRNTLLTAGRTIDIVDVGDRDSGFIITKYKNITSKGKPGPDPTFVDTDFPMFRLADIYLMYAEAVVRGGTGGSMTDAVNYVNLLRSRASSSAISSANLTLPFLIDERSRELYWEGHRRQDLVRFGLFTGGNYNWVFKGGSASGIALPSHFNVYPIPANNMAANPNLTQNTGY
ncbi:RagB/SusD family nutrient uptake outer membrane protein [Lutibacter sp.]|uniref:RagB/SusD family nutrient uptake outer membrane protein n=1 Tax=Lutibacter sp. TaxID=1925666 RepID=UPI0027328F7E|nr:RagB/SusD family nutrient uptake outer membrane protein [Lutibacter sp.]MDP3312460.1 RagB/SusD family nutrient uptake outer membrane protein [Lutibacter sp.]